MQGLELLNSEAVTPADGSKAWHLSQIQRFSGAVVKFGVIRCPRTSAFSQSDGEALATAVDARFGLPVVLRSSGPEEDGVKASLSGQYRSIGPIQDRTKIAASVLGVVASYGAVGLSIPHLAVVVHRYIDARLGGIGIVTPGGPSVELAHAVDGPSLVTSGERIDESLHGCQELKRWPWGAQLTEAFSAVQRGLGVEFVEFEWLIDAAGQMYLLQGRPLINAHSVPTERRHVT